MMTTKTEPEVLDAYKDLEAKYQKLQVSYSECLQINRLQVARINTLDLELTHLSRLLKSRESAPALLASVNPVSPDLYPLISSLACPPCGVIMNLKNPTRIKSSICQICGNEMELKK